MARASPETNLRPGGLSPSQDGPRGPPPGADKTVLTPRGPTREGGKAWERAWGGETSRKRSFPGVDKGTMETTRNRPAMRGPWQVTEKTFQSEGTDQQPRAPGVKLPLRDSSVVSRAPLHAGKPSWVTENTDEYLRANRAGKGSCEVRKHKAPRKKRLTNVTSYKLSTSVWPPPTLF